MGREMEDEAFYGIWETEWPSRSLRQKKRSRRSPDDCDRFCHYARRILGAVVTVGIGAVCDDILQLVSSYTGAREALSYWVIYEASRAINIEEIAPQKGSAQMPEYNAQIADLFKMIRLGDRGAHRGGGTSLSEPSGLFRTVAGSSIMLR